MNEIRVKVNLDNMTLGDFDNIRRGRLMSVISECVSVQGWGDISQVPIKFLKPVTDRVVAEIQDISVDEIVSPVPLDDIEIVNINEMVFGDMQAIENGMLEPIFKFVKVKGIEDMREVPFKAISLIREKLSEAIDLAADPNSWGGA